MNALVLVLSAAPQPRRLGPALACAVLLLGVAVLPACWYDEDDDSASGPGYAGEDDVEEPLTWVGGPGFYPSLVVDGDGAIHVIHHALNWTLEDPEVVRGELLYTHNVGGPFVTERVSDRSGWGGTTGLVIDGDGYAHASFVHDGEPVYATNRDGGWTFRSFPLDHELEGPGATSLAADPTGGFRLAHRDGDQVYVSDGAAANWHTESAYLGNTYEQALAVDADGRAHLAVAPAFAEELVVLVDEGYGSWSESVIQGVSSGMWALDLALDDQGGEVLAHGGGDASYLWATRRDGDGWLQVVVDPMHGGSGASVERSPAGTITISYGRGAVFLAEEGGPGIGWTIDDPGLGGYAGAPHVGVRTSLAGDAHGRPHDVATAAESSELATSLIWLTEVDGSWQQLPIVEATLLPD